jgi:hypothetical protein
MLVLHLTLIMRGFKAALDCRAHSGRSRPGSSVTIAL